MTKHVAPLLLILVLVTIAFTARAQEEMIPLLPHPKWFTCQYSLECVPVAGACNGWQTVNKRYLGIAGRYYKYWQGKRDCENSSENKTAASTLCVKGQCKFSK